MRISPSRRQNRLGQCNSSHQWAVLVSHYTVFAFTRKLYKHNSSIMHRNCGTELISPGGQGRAGLWSTRQGCCANRWVGKGEEELRPVQAAELSVGLCRTALGLCQDSELGGGEKGEREWRQ